MTEDMPSPPRPARPRRPHQNPTGGDQLASSRAASWQWEPSERSFEAFPRNRDLADRGMCRAGAMAERDWPLADFARISATESHCHGLRDAFRSTGSTIFQRSHSTCGPLSRRLEPLLGTYPRIGLEANWRARCLRSLRSGVRGVHQRDEPYDRDHASRDTENPRGHPARPYLTSARAQLTTRKRHIPSRVRRHVDRTKPGRRPSLERPSPARWRMRCGGWPQSPTAGPRREAADPVGLHRRAKPDRPAPPRRG